MTTNKAICDQQRSLEEEDSHLAAKKDNAEDLLDMITDDESESAPAIKLPAATLPQGQSGSRSESEQPQATRPATELPRDCTYVAIFKFRSAERVAPNLMGGEMFNTRNCGALYVDDDNRHVLCFTKFDFGLKQSLMYSFNPRSMECECCE